MRHSNRTGMTSFGQISSKLSSPSWAARLSYSFHSTAHRIGVLRALTKSISKLLWSLPLDRRFHCDQTKALATTCRSQCGPVKAPSSTLQGSQQAKMHAYEMYAIWELHACEMAYGR